MKFILNWSFSGCMSAFKNYCRHIHGRKAFLNRSLKKTYKTLKIRLTKECFDIIFQFRWIIRGIIEKMWLAFWIPFFSKGFTNHLNSAVVSIRLLCFSKDLCDNASLWCHTPAIFSKALAHPENGLSYPWTIRVFLDPSYNHMIKSCQGLINGCMSYFDD